MLITKNFVIALITRVWSILDLIKLFKRGQTK